MDTVPNSKTSIMEVVVDFFTEKEWSFTRSEERSAVYASFHGADFSWDCYARIYEEAQRLVFYSIPQVTIPEDKRLPVAEYFTRANYGLPIGNFELDLDDGEVRYKTSIDVEEDRLTRALLNHIIYANIVTVDKYLPGLMAVVYGDVSPAEAVAQVEESSGD